MKAPDEIHQPDNIESTASEPPDHGGPGLEPAVPVRRRPTRNATTARIWQYDLASGRSASSAKVNQSADEGRDRRRCERRRTGNLGAWESSGIVDASSVFGPGAFLVDVQAGTLVIDEEARVEAQHLTYQRDGGQLGLLRIPGA